MRVLIIGENCLDVFLYGKVERINPEAPTPVLIQTKEVTNYGMAGNVANHFNNLGIKYDFIYQSEQIYKKRYVDEKSNYILLRVDTDPKIEPWQKIPNLSKYDFIIASDYNKGFLTQEFLEKLFVKAYHSNKNVYLDSKKVLGEWSKSAWIKINEKEYNDNLKNNGYINFDKTIITLGDEGAKYKNKIIKPFNKIEARARDVVGAGDTFHVFFALYHWKTNDVELAVKMANHYAGIACSQKGVVSDFGIKEKDLWKDF